MRKASGRLADVDWEREVSAIVLRPLADAKEPFFLTTGWTIMATPIRTQLSLEVGTPAPLTLTFVQNWTALLDR